MSPHSAHSPVEPLDLSRWRKLPNLFMGGGAVLAVLGAVLNLDHFGYAWLVAFMFCLSLCLGSLFLVLVHHLFDAGWSVPIRRFCEHIATLLFPWMAILFIPIAILARRMYPWMGPELQAHPDHALAAKQPLFTVPMFYITAALCFAVWCVLSNSLRSWSLKQDETGAALCTRKMRVHAGWGIFAFAITLTLGAFMWMKSLQHQWFSTMYGVIYFAGSVWTTLATVYLITVVLQRTGTLRAVLHEHQFYFLGSLLLAFTVFYAYVHYSQYFIIWNANIPEETFWYKQRETGTWWWVGMIIIFGHFFVPFLALLRIDAKLTLAVMIPLGVWAWLMHFFDLAFNIMPVLHPNNFPIAWVWVELGCLAFMGGLLTKIFVAKFVQHAPFPLKDPRLNEAMGFYHPVPSQISGGELDETEDFTDAAQTEPNGGSR